MKRGPTPPTSSVEEDYIWFPVRITSVPSAGQYIFQEVWVTPGGVIADKAGGRFNDANDLAYAIDGSTFTTTAAGAAVQAIARRSQGSGGVGWELMPVGGGGPDATKTTRGWVSATAQTFGGLKTFYSGIKVGDGTVGTYSGIVFQETTGLGLTSIVGSNGAFNLNTGVGGILAGACILGGGLGTYYAIADGVGFYTGLTTTFLTGDGRTATFKGGILTGLA